MEKIRVCLLCGLLAGLLTGCQAAEEELPERGGNEEVCLELSDPEEPGPEGGRFILSQTSGGEEEIWYYDDCFLIERYEDGVWESLPVLNGFCETVLYRELRSSEPAELSLEWGWIYGDLEPGVYCLSKLIFPQRDGSANAVIRELLPSEERYDFSCNPGPDTEKGERVCTVFEIHSDSGLPDD